MTLKIAFSVDDMSPTPGYGLLLENDPLGYLKKLHDEFGCKFTMFAIPMLDGNPKNSWDNNKVWVEKIKAMDYLEIAQHGLTHKAQKPEWGAQELLGLPDDDIEARILEGRAIFRRVGIDVKGFKAPGWAITPSTYKILEHHGYRYVGDHFMGNQILYQGKLIRVPYTFSINRIYHDRYDDYIILHSHINKADGNLNGWTKELYEVVANYLRALHKKYDNDIQYVTISELVEDQDGTTRSNK